MADADLPLVRALQSGDESALEALMTRYQDGLFRFIRGYVLNEADATDLTQETFVRVYFNIGRFKPTAKFATWLYRIALNLCRDHAKSRRVRYSTVTDSLSAPDVADGAWEQELPAVGKTPAETLAVSEKMRALDGAIAQLPHDLRAALSLSVLEQRSHQECAELLGTTAKGVETRVYRARKLLVGLMRKAGF